MLRAATSFYQCDKCEHVNMMLPCSKFFFTILQYKYVKNSFCTEIWGKMLIHYVPFKRYFKCIKVEVKPTEISLVSNRSSKIALNYNKNINK